MKTALVLDVGTTGVKSFIFNENLDILAREYFPLVKTSPEIGWIEQDPGEIVRVSSDLLQRVVAKNKLDLKNCLGLGITNQRESVVAWDGQSGRAIYPVIVWEDSRTADYCRSIQTKDGDLVRHKTGLPLDPYFSAPKIRWLLENIPDAENLTQNGKLNVGTIDSWVVWNLSVGNNFVTDETNASRTLVFNIVEKKRDSELLRLFKIPAGILPETKFSRGNFGTLKKEIVGLEIPIVVVVGDQQASCFAAGTKVGTTKITFGTGTFLMQIVGDSFQLVEPFLTTLAVGKGKSVFALEAKIGEHGDRVTNLLRKGKSLDPICREIAADVARVVRLLPLPPVELILDGGIVQASNLIAFQQEASGLPVRVRSSYDGTAVGCAKLVFTSF